LHLCYYYLFFKAASLDGHMAFLVAVHYVIFLLEILYASLENKFFFFFFFFYVQKNPLLLKAAIEEDYYQITKLHQHTRTVSWKVH